MKYQITVAGVLDEDWSDWLGRVEICRDEENASLVTILCGEIPDQPALFGILDHIRDLNLILISVVQLR